MQTNPEDEKDDPVWDLLNRARPIKPSAFFSRNVVREVRQLRNTGGNGVNAVSGLAWWTRLSRPATANIAIAALAVAALVLFLVNHQSQVGNNSDGPGAIVQVPADGETSGPGSARAMEFDPAAEIGNLEYLGQLMAVTDPAALDDHALADLLF